LISAMARPRFIPWRIRPALALGLLGCVSGHRALAVSDPTPISASDVAAGDTFGYSVSVSGNAAVIGARLDDTDAGVNTGSAYVFDPATGVQTFKLTADDAEPGDFFGRSVAVSGTTAVVGAAMNDDAGTDSGSAYVFDTNTGRQLFKLAATDASASDQFGHAVAVGGNTAVIAAPWEDQAGTNAGSAYVFNTATGAQLYKLIAQDAGAGDLFGFSLADDDGLALIGAMSDDAGTDSGSAYLFDTTTGAQRHKLTASDAAAGDRFGSVALSGNLALIGAPGNDSAVQDAGAAYLFDATTGNELFKLTATDASPGSLFGFSVALSGNLALVGAYGDNNGTGAIYGFDAFTGNPLFKFTPTGTRPGDALGFSVALNGLTAAIGAPLAGSPATNAGTAYLLDLPPPPPPILGDLDHDGFVGIDDLNFMLLFWNENAGFQQPQPGDITGDGFVGLDDLNFLLGNWNQGIPPAPGSLGVPEPGAMGLTSILLVLHFTFQRPRPPA
jgi:outer membrane protein assembly factor BamB